LQNYCSFAGTPVLNTCFGLKSSYVVKIDPQKNLKNSLKLENYNLARKTDHGLKFTTAIAFCNGKSWPILFTRHMQRRQTQRRLGELMLLRFGN